MYIIWNYGIPNKSVLKRGIRLCKTGAHIRRKKNNERTGVEKRLESKLRCMEDKERAQAAVAEG